ncbi:MAG: hypothetical protein H6907_16305 [Hyphomicrobiales bacterium]|nr:hypothetical protein [Hyphomicrobiales bacterium]MCP5373289.1 hypothetical protein [Hyphomicrobiales bacterium]
MTNKGKAYLRNLLVLLPLVLLVLLLHGAYDTLKEVPNLRRALTADYDILYFGDSVVESWGACDTDAETIDRKLAARLAGRDGGRVLAMTHGAYSPRVYARLVDLLALAAHRPRFVIVPLNPRSFSAQWIDQPLYTFPATLALLDLLAGRDVAANLVTYLDARYADLVARRTAAWKDRRIVYDGYDLGVRRDFDDRVVGALLDQPQFECKPGAEAPFADVLRDLYVYHYMNTVTAGHPMFAFLRRFHARARALGMTPLYYITPVNLEEGERRVGPAFRARVTANLRVMGAELEALGASWLDMSFDLPAARFVDRKWVAEHLDARGRAHVANRLANRLAELLAAPTEARGAAGPGAGKRLD